jgi:hypothetical protein
MKGKTISRLQLTRGPVVTEGDQQGGCAMKAGTRASSRRALARAASEGARVALQNP